ncbi:MAG: hypothetical protein ACO3JL_06180 [Myxococcota bacterium]
MATRAGSATISGRRTLRHLFEESMQQERKLLFHGPDNIRPDSRYAIVEAQEDHVVFRLLGDDLLVIPYASITSLRVSMGQVVIRYGG